MVNAIVIAQDFFNGFSDDSSLNPSKSFQNFHLYIGNTPDPTKSQQCPGGPFMTLDAWSDGWYKDRRTSTDVWTFGIEKWCNMEGQYVHIVADLSHLVTTTYEMSLCSVGIMGTSFERSEPVPNHTELTQGESNEIPVPHIFDEYRISTGLRINLRQTASAALPFVTISEEAERSIVRIDSIGLEIGDYALHLESFDALSTL